MLPSRELAEIAVKALDSKKGKEIRLIRIDKITTLAEYFVICTGTSNTQINALCDEVEKELDRLRRRPRLQRRGAQVLFPRAPVGRWRGSRPERHPAPRRGKITLDKAGQNA